jgi:hypothetical protein
VLHAFAFVEVWKHRLHDKRFEVIRLLVGGKRARVAPGEP